MSGKFKKVVMISAGVGVGVCVIAGAFYIMKNKLIEMKYEGDTYYTKVVEEGVFDNEANQYRYILEGVSEEKGNIMLDFYGMDKKPIKENAYLEITYRSPEGVLRWRGIDKTDVPEKILVILEQ